jgi:hypothetical protein
MEGSSRLMQEIACFISIALSSKCDIMMIIYGIYPQNDALFTVHSHVFREAVRRCWKVSATGSKSLVAIVHLLSSTESLQLRSSADAGNRKHIQLRSGRSFKFSRTRRNQATADSYPSTGSSWIVVCSATGLKTSLTNSLTSFTPALWVVQCCEGTILVKELLLEYQLDRTSNLRNSAIQWTWKREISVVWALFVFAFVLASAKKANQRQYSASSENLRRRDRECKTRDRR